MTVNDDSAIPSMLDQYASMYNKNGRIGIYTKKERVDIIARFREKRRKRVWKKKIRYHCRKNLADKRVRIKGRFVRKTEDAHEGGEDSSGDEDIDINGNVESPEFIIAEGMERNVESSLDGSVVEVKDEDSRSLRADSPAELGVKRMRRHSIAY